MKTWKQIWRTQKKSERDLTNLNKDREKQVKRGHRRNDKSTGKTKPESERILNEIWRVVQAMAETIRKK